VSKTPDTVSAAAHAILRHVEAWNDVASLLFDAIRVYFSSVKTASHILQFPTPFSIEKIYKTLSSAIYFNIAKKRLQ